MTTGKKSFKAAIVLFTLVIVTVSNFTSESHVGSELINEEQSPIKNPISSGPFDDGILFSGSQDAISVNETAIYRDTSQLSVGNGSIPAYTSQTLEFPLDTTNSWEGYL